MILLIKCVLVLLLSPFILIGLEDNDEFTISLLSSNTLFSASES